MLSGSCHCGAVRIEIPRRPRTLTAYHKAADVRVEPAEIGAVRIRLLDGAKTWKYLD
jgi:hypothetical protein